VEEKPKTKQTPEKPKTEAPKIMVWREDQIGKRVEPFPTSSSAMVAIYDANLCGASLCDAELKNAELRNANLSDANLSNADFNGANTHRGCFLFDEVSSQRMDEIKK
jgi:hypothetical protein